MTEDTINEKDDTTNNDKSRIIWASELSSPYRRRRRPLEDLNIFCAGNHAKKLILSRTLLVALNRPESVQFILCKRHILIGESLEQDKDYAIDYSDDNGHIYSSSLVDDIVDKYDLDSINETRHLFSITKIKIRDGRLAAKIKIITGEVGG